MTGVTFDEYLELLKITERLGELEVTGSYSARKTLKLLDSMTPPHKWIFPGTMSEIDASRPAYRKMADIFESVRKGNFYKPYANASGSDHAGALIDLVRTGRISNRELLHYLYSQKKPADSKTYDDKVVDILLIYMLTYSMDIGSDSKITHDLVLDKLVTNTDYDF
jgi:hypothetical protein